MINVWFDGACVPTNPGGIASFGIIIKKDGKLLYSKTGFVGTPPNTTNNLAEHAGLLNALIWLKENDLHTDKIHVYGDSNLVIKQIFGKWKIKRGVYKEIALQTKLDEPCYYDAYLDWLTHGCLL